MTDMTKDAASYIDYTNFDPYAGPFGIGGSGSPVGQAQAGDAGSFGPPPVMTRGQRNAFIKSGVDAILASNRTDAEKTQLIADIAASNDISLRDFSDVSGIPVSVITQAANTHKVNFPGVSPPASPLRALGIPADGDYSAQEQAQVVDLINRGVVTLDQAADFYGVSPEAAQRAVSTQPISAAVVGGVPGAGSPNTSPVQQSPLEALGIPVDGDYSQEEQDQIVGLIEDGVITIDEAADFFGVPRAIAQAALDSRKSPLEALGIPIDGDYSTEEQDKVVGLIKDGAVTVDEAADFYGVPRAVAQGAYDARQSPLEALGIPVDGDYSQEEQDKIAGLVDSGKVSIDDAADFYGVPRDIARAAYNARGTTDDTDDTTPVVGGGSGTTGVVGGGSTDTDTDDGTGFSLLPGVGAAAAAIPAFTSAQRTGLFGAAPSGETFSTSVTIPPFLEQFVVDSADTSTGALSSLDKLLSQPEALVSPFNPLQVESQGLAEAMARDPDGFLTQAQDVLRGVADDTDLKALFNRGAGLLENPSGLSKLNTFSGTSALNPIANTQLEGTASGNYLYGNPAFDEAVQASIRAARPGILSRFATGGPGAAEGGLAQTAMQQAASDAFAGLFSQERGRQVNASDILNTSGINDRTLQQNAATSIVDAQQNAGQQFTNIADRERTRQINAAAALPQLGLLQSGILGDIGNLQQAQSEREKLGDVSAMQELLGSSFGNINPTVFMGNSQAVPMQDQNKWLTGLGGGLLGSQLGGLLPKGFDLFGMSGSQAGGVLGGLLGAFG